MPSPRKVSPSPSLSACTSFLKERSITSSCAGYIYNGSKANATAGRQRMRGKPAARNVVIAPRGTGEGDPFTCFRSKTGSENPPASRRDSRRVCCAGAGRECGVAVEQGWLGGREGRREAGGRSGWRQRLRTYVVTHGIQVMCGSTGDVSAAAAADVPLFSGAMRLAWLKALEAVGVTRFVATSGLGYDFVCHTGDLANFPFYLRRAYQAELELCAAWLHGEDRPVVYDIGANAGFISTHLAQMLAGRAPKIYAFEPVPATFAKLAQSVERLGLTASVHPVPAAVVDTPGPVRISYSEKNSLLAQVSSRGLHE